MIQNVKIIQNMSELHLKNELNAEKCKTNTMF